MRDAERNTLIHLSFIQLDKYNRFVVESLHFTGTGTSINHDCIQIEQVLVELLMQVILFVTE